MNDERPAIERIVEAYEQTIAAAGARVEVFFESHGRYRGDHSADAVGRYDR